MSIVVGDARRESETMTRSTEAHFAFEDKSDNTKVLLGWHSVPYQLPHDRVLVRFGGLSDIQHVCRCNMLRVHRVFQLHSSEKTDLFCVCKLSRGAGRPGCERCRAKECRITTSVLLKQTSGGDMTRKRSLAHSSLTRKTIALEDWGIA